MKKLYRLNYNLSECKNYLAGYGGHPIAAGLSILPKNFEKFKELFLDVANKQISIDALHPKIYIDSEINLDDINNRMLNFLKALEPYGPGNSRPIFLVRNVSVDGIPKLIGRDQNTLKFFLKKNKTHFESIGFNMAEHYEKLIQNAPIDVAFMIGENDWNGKKSIQLELKDIKLYNQYD